MSKREEESRSQLLSVRLRESDYKAFKSICHSLEETMSSVAGGILCRYILKVQMKKAVKEAPKKAVKKAVIKVVKKVVVKKAVKKAVKKVGN